MFRLEHCDPSVLIDPDRALYRKGKLVTVNTIRASLSRNNANPLTRSADVMKWGGGINGADEFDGP